MADPIQIKRYPNRRYYARHQSKYVSLQEIEELIQGGATVEIRDSQSGDDLTRVVLTQIIVERQPAKMSLFPSDMLHFIVRSNDVMSEFLRDYFRQSLTYLDYLQRHSGAGSIAQPMHWMRAWLDALTPSVGSAEPGPAHADSRGPQTARGEPSVRDPELARRVEELEARLRQLEAKDDESQST